MKEKQLIRAKELARTFLYLPMEPSKFGAAVVRHPFFESGYLMDRQGMFNALEDEARYSEYLRKFAGESIEGCQDLDALVSLIRKSYRLVFLLYMKNGKIISTKECGNLLAGQWSLIENLSHDVNVRKDTVLRWIMAADKDALMDASELRQYEALPDTVTVYRGCRVPKAMKGLSWTLSEKKARWFADRLSLLLSRAPGGRSLVYRAKIKKEDIIGYLSGRGEQEVVVNYRKLFNIECVCD